MTADFLAGLTVGVLCGFVGTCCGLLYIVACILKDLRSSISK